MPWWPFTRKVKPTANHSPEWYANQKALAEVRKKYGRVAHHSRVANVLRPEEGLHDPFAIERKELAQKFLEEAPKKAQKFTSNEKQALMEWGQQLKMAINEENSLQRGGGNSSGFINLPIPMLIGKILLYVIGFALLAMTVAAVFVDIAVAFTSDPGSSNPFVSALLFNQACSLMFGQSTFATSSGEYQEDVSTANPAYSAQQPAYNSRRSRRNNRK